jgi:hypothetical protein
MWTLVIIGIIVIIAVAKIWHFIYVQYRDLQWRQERGIHLNPSTNYTNPMDQIPPSKRDALHKKWRIDATKRKSDKQPVALSCGYCGVFFEDWQPAHLRCGDLPEKIGFRSFSYSNTMNQHKKGAIDVEDIHGPVGVCSNCWLVFCGLCAKGKNFFAKDSWAASAPSYECPFCGLQLDIQSVYFGDLMKHL